MTLIPILIAATITLTTTVMNKHYHVRHSRRRIIGQTAEAATMAILYSGKPLEWTCAGVRVDQEWCKR